MCIVLSLNRCETNVRAEFNNNIHNNIIKIYYNILLKTHLDRRNWTLCRQ